MQSDLLIETVSGGRNRPVSQFSCVFRPGLFSRGADGVTARHAACIPAAASDAGGWRDAIDGRFCAVQSDKFCDANPDELFSGDRIADIVGTFFAQQDYVSRSLVEAVVDILQRSVIVSEADALKRLETRSWFAVPNLAFAQVSGGETWDQKWRAFVHDQQQQYKASQKPSAPTAESKPRERAYFRPGADHVWSRGVDVQSQGLGPALHRFDWMVLSWDVYLNGNGKPVYRCRPPMRSLTTDGHKRMFDFFVKQKRLSVDYGTNTLHFLPFNDTGTTRELMIIERGLNELEAQAMCDGFRRTVYVWLNNPDSSDAGTLQLGFSPQLTMDRVLTLQGMVTTICRGGAGVHISTENGGLRVTIREADFNNRMVWQEAVATGIDIARFCFWGNSYLVMHTGFKEWFPLTWQSLGEGKGSQALLFDAMDSNAQEKLKSNGVFLSDDGRYMLVPSDSPDVKMYAECAYNTTRYGSTWDATVTNSFHFKMIEQNTQLMTALVDPLLSALVHNLRLATRGHVSASPGSPGGDEPSTGTHTIVTFERMIPSVMIPVIIAVFAVTV